MEQSVSFQNIRHIELVGFLYLSECIIHEKVNGRTTGRLQGFCGCEIKSNNACWIGRNNYARVSWTHDRVIRGRQIKSSFALKTIEEGYHFVNTMILAQDHIILFLNMWTCSMSIQYPWADHFRIININQNGTSNEIERKTSEIWKWKK